MLEHSWSVVNWSTLGAIKVSPDRIEAGRADTRKNETLGVPRPCEIVLKLCPFVHEKGQGYSTVSHTSWESPGFLLDYD
jgi:hypothetical protein